MCCQGLTKIVWHDQLTKHGFPLVPCVYLHSMQYSAVHCSTSAKSLWAETWAINKYWSFLLGILFCFGLFSLSRILTFLLAPGYLRIPAPRWKGSVCWRSDMIPPLCERAVFNLETCCWRQGFCHWLQWKLWFNPGFCSRQQPHFRLEILSFDLICKSDFPSPALRIWTGWVGVADLCREKVGECK